MFSYKIELSLLLVPYFYFGLCNTTTSTVSQTEERVTDTESLTTTLSACKHLSRNKSETDGNTSCKIAASQHSIRWNSESHRYVNSKRSCQPCISR